MRGIRVNNTYQLSPACVQFMHCAQGATDTQITDRSSYGNNIDKGSGQTWDNVTGTYGVWGTQGRARTYGHSNETRTWLTAKSWFDRYTSADHSILFFARGEFTRPGSTLMLYRLGVSSNLAGLQIRMNAGGTLDGFVRDGDNILLSLADTTAAVADGTNDSWALLLNGATKEAAFWVSGVKQTAETLPSGKIIASNTPASGFFGNTDGSVAASYQEWHTYVMQQTPDNIDDLVSSLHYRRYTPLQAHEVIA
jgi:hypothetical protein